VNDEELTTRDLAARPAEAESSHGARDAGPVTTDDATDDATQPAADGRPVAARGAGDEQEPLFRSEQAQQLAERWQEIQASFVDQPRESVEQADMLVADLMQRLASTFSDERQRLEAQWDSGGDVSTEDLRIALTRYRSFFDRLLAV
jgi:hypothetical protein